MSVADVEIHQQSSVPVPTYVKRTEAGASDINAGEPVKVGGTGNKYVVPLAGGDPVTGSDRVAGIAAEASSHTASSDADILLYKPIPGAVFRCDANNSGNIGDSIRNDRVTFDLNSGTYTVDEDEGDASDHGLVIEDFDANAGTVDFTFSTAVTVLGNNDA